MVLKYIEENHMEKEGHFKLFPAPYLRDIKKNKFFRDRK